MITAGVRFHDAGIDREGFTLDQTGVHARPHHRLEYLAEQVAIAEPAVTIDRERRVIGHIVVEVEPAEPSVGQMQLDFLAQLPLKMDAVAVADDQHPDHQLGVDRGPANLAIKGRQLLAKLNQYPGHDRIDPAQKMARWNAPFQVEQVTERAAADRLLRKPTIGSAACCARAVIGDRTTDPPRSVMNSRRLMRLPQAQRQHPITSARRLCTTASDPCEMTLWVMNRRADHRLP